MISTIIFDLDGTLLDTTEYVYQAFEYSLQKHFKPIPREKIQTVIGKPLEECFRILTGRHDVEQFCSKAHKSFQRSHPELSKLYPHVRETLQTLQERRLNLAILTSRSSDTTHETILQENIGPYFQHIFAIEDVTYHKPHPEGIQKLLKLFDASADQALMVGDSAVDIEAGVAAGVGTVGAAYGFHGNRIKDSNPDFVIESFDKLLDVLSSYRSRV